MYSSTPTGITKLLLSLLLPISITFVLILISSTKPLQILFTSINVPRTHHDHIIHIHTYNHYQIAHSTCEGTLYPQLCVSTLLSFPNLASRSLPQLISATINATVSEVQASSSNCTGISHKLIGKLRPIETIALRDCLELFDDTVSELESAISDLSTRNTASRHYNDLQTLLSGAMTNQYTCLDGFAYSKGHVREKIERGLYKISRHVSNSLAMLRKIHGVKTTSYSSEVFPEYGEVKNGFPTWLSVKDRELLEASVNATKFDLIVAKDGSGNFTTINQAVAAAPNSSNTRFVIYIKEGAYFENVEVEKKKTMVMFIGDGIGKTVIKANRNVVDGWTTFRSATLAVVGKGFIAKGITVENSSGPNKHQAVALRSGSDLSAFFNSSFVGYQDTLYAHSLRQFYRDCDIYGTVDFIFGNAAVVFQNCNLYARKPNQNQKNIFTAQGRDDPFQNTGISILNCKVVAAAELIPFKTAFKTYLGRPWKEYSRTVFMRSYIDDAVDTAGWLEWNGTFGLGTLYYGEYKNRGPGSNTSGRVTWPGYRILNETEAGQFTVGAFIQGGEWLNSTGIPYFLNLTS